MTETLSEARAVLDQAVQQGEFPGFVACAAKDTVEGLLWGGVARYGGSEVSLETRYDLASLTKVVSTLPALTRLVSEGELAFDDPVGKFFSNAGWFQSPSLAQVTVRQLLSHSSGLPAWKPLFSFISERHTGMANVLQTALEHPAGTIIYSDLGFIALGAIIERISKVRQDEFVKRYIFEPLAMTSTSYGPIAGVPVAATEDCGFRNKLLEGIVHDENAYALAGIAGHAGLFGTAIDLAKYARAWLSFNSVLGKEEVLAETLKEQVHQEGLRRGLGWLLKSEHSFAGSLATEQGFGHTGFTGTSLWLEPAQGWYAVLLTNRVHPSRHCGSRMHEVRRSFYEAVARILSTGDK